MEDSTNSQEVPTAEQEPVQSAPMAEQTQDSHETSVLPSDDAPALEAERAELNRI